MESLSEKLNKVGRMTPDWCIYRVPKRLRQVNPDAYTPHLISIGPFHYNKEPGLADMDEHKWRYTLSLLRRVVGQDNSTDDPLKSWYDDPLKSCYNAILHAETEIKDRYAATIHLASDELAKMLLLDACFILELFFRYSERELSEKVQNDPVFQSEWILSALRRDLALLENQIPFFVLKRLFYMVVEHDASLRADYLPIMAFNFFYGSTVERQIPLLLMEGEGRNNRINDCKHLLHLLLKCHLPWPPQSRPSGSITSTTTKARAVTIPNVKSLIEAGGTIKIADDPNNLFDIRFARGVLHIPTLHIHEWTSSLFRNLIAFEHCCPENGGQYIVSYIVLMDRLINNREDVELLKRNGIITVELGGSEDVTQFFKDICRQVILKDFYFQDQCEKMQEHDRSRLRKNLRALKIDYLKNFWTILSLIAAAILLVCTIIQTVNSF